MLLDCFLVFSPFRSSHFDAGSKRRGDLLASLANEKVVDFDFLLLETAVAVQTALAFSSFRFSLLDAWPKRRGSACSLDNEKVVDFDFALLKPVFVVETGYVTSRLFVSAILTLKRKGGGCA